METLLSLEERILTPEQLIEVKKQLPIFNLVVKNELLKAQYQSILTQVFTGPQEYDRDSGIARPKDLNSEEVLKKISAIQKLDTTVLDIDQDLKSKALLISELQTKIANAESRRKIIDINESGISNDTKTKRITELKNIPDQIENWDSRIQRLYYQEENLVTLIENILKSPEQAINGQAQVIENITPLMFDYELKPIIERLTPKPKPVVEPRIEIPTEPEKILEPKKPNFYERNKRVLDPLLIVTSLGLATFGIWHINQNSYTPQYLSSEQNKPKILEKIVKLEPEMFKGVIKKTEILSATANPDYTDLRIAYTISEKQEFEYNHNFIITEGATKKIKYYIPTSQKPLENGGFELKYKELVIRKDNQISNKLNLSDTEIIEIWPRNEVYQYLETLISRLNLTYNITWNGKSYGYAKLITKNPMTSNQIEGILLTNNPNQEYRPENNTTIPSIETYNPNNQTKFLPIAGIEKVLTQTTPLDHPCYGLLEISSLQGYNIILKKENHSNMFKMYSPEKRDKDDKTLEILTTLQIHSKFPSITVSN